MTLKFDEWPWKTIGYLFYVTSSFVHHFIAISKFKLELQSGNIKFGSKSVIFCAEWPWNLMDDLEKLQGSSSMLLQALYIISLPSVNSNWSYSPETPNSGQNQRLFVPCDLEIWRMTLKNNRAPLLCHIKLCTSFHCHMWIQTGVTVRKQLSCDLDLWSLTLAFHMDITFVNGNHSWKFHDDTMTGTLWKRCHRQTDRRTGRRMDRCVLRAAWSQLKTMVGYLIFLIWQILIIYKKSHIKSIL